MSFTSSLALRLAGAEELVARSDAFRKRVGAFGIGDAKNSIHVGECTLEDVLEMYEGGSLDFARPSAVIGIHTHGFAQISQGGQIDLGANGSVWMILTDTSQDPQNQKASMYDFVDWIGRVVDEIAANCGKDYGAEDYTLWPYTSIVQMFAPVRADVADRQAEDFWLGGYLLIDNAFSGGQ